MGHPGPVRAIAGLSLLVLAHGSQRPLGHLRLTSVGYEGAHAPDGVRPAGVTRPNQQLLVGAHERDGHGHLPAIRQDLVGPGVELLDDREDVVPAARVEPGGVVAELVQDLVHLEGGQDRLDQHRGTD